jgi:hypothetical protein
MAKLITVLESFTEQRTGKTYTPGEVVIDPEWHKPDSRRAEAYATRGKVRVDEAADGAPGTVVFDGEGNPMVSEAIARREPKRLRSSSVIEGEG